MIIILIAVIFLALLIWFDQMDGIYWWHLKRRPQNQREWLKFIFRPRLYFWHHELGTFINWCDGGEAPEGAAVIDRIEINEEGVYVNDEQVYKHDR